VYAPSNEGFVIGLIGRNRLQLVAIHPRKLKYKLSVVSFDESCSSRRIAAVELYEFILNFMGETLDYFTIVSPMPCPPTRLDSRIDSTDFFSASY
jgi:hypothetical protein